MLADTIAAEIAAHRRTLYAPSTYRGVLSYTCHRCGAPHSRTAEDIDRERTCRACRDLPLSTYCAHCGGRFLAADLATLRASGYHAEG